ncbi:MAG: SDR family NAD(P)-dependent oxidoreductase [Ktedonobacterales bacterium]
MAQETANRQVTQAQTMQPIRRAGTRGGALIVGASSGIGAALAQTLAALGYTLALVARRADVLTTLCDTLNGQYTGATPIARAYPHDVRDYDAAPDLFTRICDELAPEGLRLVVYVAGVMPRGENESSWTFAEERDTVETNLIGAIRWLDLAADTFTQAGRGAIVGVSSVAGERGRRGNSVYMASKAGLSVYLESLRYRLHGSGVRVVTVKPGYVATPLVAGLALPKPLVVSAETVARRIAQVAERGPQVVYIPGWWWAIMAGVRSLPAFAMTRLPI